MRGGIKDILLRLWWKNYTHRGNRKNTRLPVEWTHEPERPTTAVGGHIDRYEKTQDHGGRSEFKVRTRESNTWQTKVWEALEIRTHKPEMNRDNRPPSHICITTSCSDIPRASGGACVLKARCHRPWKRPSAMSESSGRAPITVSAMVKLYVNLFVVKHSIFLTWRIGDFICSKFEVASLNHSFLVFSLFWLPLKVLSEYSMDEGYDILCKLLHNYAIIYTCTLILSIM